MANFQYSALDAKGEQTDGVVAANSEPTDGQAADVVATDTQSAYGQTGDVVGADAQPADREADHIVGADAQAANEDPGQVVGAEADAADRQARDMAIAVADAAENHTRAAVRFVSDQVQHDAVIAGVLIVTWHAKGEVQARDPLHVLVREIQSDTGEAGQIAETQAAAAVWQAQPTGVGAGRTDHRQEQKNQGAYRFHGHPFGTGIRGGHGLGRT